MARTDAVLEAIGGQISQADARRLILKKIYDIAHAELDRYLNAEKRALVRVVENLWEKYAIAADEVLDRTGEQALSVGASAPTRLLTTMGGRQAAQEPS